MIATIGWFVLVDFPDKMKNNKRKFLEPREYDFILQRIEKDRSDTTLEPFKWSRYLGAGLDLNIWAFGFIYFSTTTTAYAISYFLPIIYQEGMGFSVGVSLCLFAPPYAAAGIVMFVTSYFGDKYRVRGPILVFNSILTLIGLPLMVSNSTSPSDMAWASIKQYQGFAKGNGPRLVGCFFTTMGANSNVPAAMAYQVRVCVHS